ncbi:SDR family NAD(P)-dependent oxidoreductase [Oceanibium sediminis]|uniref:SDR family NAD(P)-dependent oxidoreductase n=1 Tax=Oceanibium sediminis TaxID=2026339 RepID=UPI000DD2B6A9|nr:glucose 1-dehydrogenase [Oceanibium sediminis]
MTELPVIPTFRLDGKRALVTGASSGIGLAAATALAQAGAELTLVARNPDRLAEVADAFTKAGLPAESLALDIGDIDATAEAIRQAGPFDILVNSAGCARHQPALEVTADAFDQVMGVNLRGAFFVTQAVAQGLARTGRPGSLINISSQMGHVGGYDRAVYCASKHAVEGFTKAMAIEWGPSGIRVNTVCPTFVRTALTESTFQDLEHVERIREKIKLGRVGTPGDVAGAVLYLASEASALVTGTSLLVDGGWTAE